MREHELQMILLWIGLQQGKLITEQMLRDAINYAYNAGLTDGKDGKQ